MTLATLTIHAAAWDSRVAEKAGEGFKMSDEMESWFCDIEEF